MKSTRNTIAILIVSSLASGCSNVAPISEEMIYEKAAEISAEQSKLDEADVALLGSYKLALKKVSNDHPRIKSAISAANQAAQAVTVSSAAQKPQANATGRIGKYDEGNGWSNGATLGVDVTQLLYDGGATRSEMNAAQVAKVQADLNVIVTRNQVLQRAISTWVEVWSLQERINQMKLRLEEAQPLISRIKKMAETGLADRTIIEKADKSLLDVKLEQQRLEAALSETTGEFETYFGKLRSHLVSPNNLINSKFLEQSLGKWENSQQLKVQALDIAIAEYNLSVAEADLKPQFFGSVGSTAPLSGENPVKSIGLTMKYTFGDGGRRKARIASAKERLLDAKSNLEMAITAKKGSALSYKLSYADIHTGIALVEQQIKVLKQSRDTARSQIASAQSNLNTLLETEIDLYRAEDRLLSLKAEKLKLEAQILELNGMLYEKIKN